MTTEEVPAEEPVVPPEQEEPTEATPEAAPEAPAHEMPAPSEEENLRSAFEKGASNRGE